MTFIQFNWSAAFIGVHGRPDMVVVKETRCLATVAMPCIVHVGTSTKNDQYNWSIIVPSFMLVSPTEQFWLYFAPVA